MARASYRIVIEAIFINRLYGSNTFLHEDCPKIWKIVTIIPPLKFRKPASKAASFSPVSLSSCKAELTKRIPAKRIYPIAETNNMLSKLQAEFRWGRSCEYNITRVIQKLMNQFDQKPCLHRSVLLLQDFSEAFRTVWWQKLLLSIYDKGIPGQMIRWLRSFLNDRVSDSARVNLYGHLNNSYVFKQGLSQGSVLSSLWILFYISSLAQNLTDDAHFIIFFGREVHSVPS